jgi:hypothetical protein
LEGDVGERSKSNSFLVFQLPLLNLLLDLGHTSVQRRRDIRKQNNNLFLLFFTWWYHQGFLSLLNYLKGVSAFMTDFFSVRMIFRTLFEPWKRDQIGTQNLSIKEKFDVMILNMVSRMVGFFVKILLFFIYLLFMAGFLIVSAVACLIWLALPFIALALVLLGIFEIMVNR